MVLRRHRDPPRGRSTLAEDHATWLNAAIRMRAHRYGVEADDLRQRFETSLLRRSTTVDEGNPGVRKWLWQRITWTAQDMLRQRGRDIPTDPADLPAPAADGGVEQISLAELVRRARRNLVRFGLTANEAQTVALVCTGSDMPLNEFALLVGRSHDSVRQERTRGLRKIKNHFGLTAEEDEVLQGWRAFGSAHAAAPHLRRSEDEIHRIVGSAHKKIDEVFGEKEV